MTIPKIPKKYFYLIQAFSGVLLIFCVSMTGHADFSGSVTATTDYIWRGYSKSDRKPALQTNIDYEFKSGIYLGAFVSTINFNDDEFKNPSRIEFKPYAGFAYALSDDWRFNIEWTRYIFNGKIFGQTVDYNEFYLYGHFRDLLTVNFGFSENGYQQNHISFNSEVSGRYPIAEAVELSGTLGYSNQTKVLNYDDFVYLNFGLAWYASRNLGLDLRYYKGHYLGKEKEIASGWQFDPKVVHNSVVFSITVGF